MLQNTALASSGVDVSIVAIIAFAATVKVSRLDGNFVPSKKGGDEGCTFAGRPPPAVLPASLDVLGRVRGEG